MIRALIFFMTLLSFGSHALAQMVAPIAPPLAPESMLKTPLPVQSSAEAMEADASEYAQMFRVSTFEALRRMQAQEASVPLIDRLVEGYRDRLAGVIIEHTPIYQIVIAVTGPPSPDVQIATAPFDVPVVLRSGSQRSRADILDAIEHHQADIRAALPSPPGMGVDPQTGMLLVVTRPGDLDGDADKTATASRLSALAGVPVEVKIWGDFNANVSAEGGGRVIGHNAENAARFVCTSGFVVTDGIDTALSTAAHCPDELSFVDRTGDRIPLVMIGAWGARYQDVQLHSAGIALLPTFHGDSESRDRSVLTWRNRLSTRVGDFVCHRGQRTGYSCATVQLVDYAPPGDLCAGPCPATWVAVSGPKCGGGDSGGPVFFGTVAFGLVKGDSATNGTCRLYYYMSTDYLPAGWTLLHPLSAITRSAGRPDHDPTMLSQQRGNVEIASER